MRVAVTGASGFIGGYVVAELGRRGIATTLICRPGTQPAGQQTCLEMDLLKPPPQAYELMLRPDVLIHLAWGGLPNYTSLHHFEEELPAQYAFLKSLIQAGLPRLLVTGSCAEYGVQSGCLGEGSQARPVHAYGFAKDCLRRQLEFLKQQLPFELVWARLFYLYGQGQSPKSLFSQLQRAVARGDKVFPMSGGEQLRDYLPIHEAARLLVSLLAPQAGEGVTNVCAGKPISVRTLVEGWIKEHGWSIALKLGHYPYPDYESMAFWGDAQELNRRLESL